MASKYFKSLLLLLGFGSAGYILLEVSKPSEDKLKQIRAIGGTSVLSEEERKKILFLRKLKQSANLEPEQHGKQN